MTDATIYYESQYFTTTLSKVGGLNASQTTGIVLQSVSGIFDTTKPGIALLNYSDPLSTTVAEWATFTSINSTTKTLVGVTRGAEGFSAKTHDNGITVAFPHSKSHINEIADALKGIKTIPNDLNLATGKNIQVNSADPYRTIVLPAGSMSPTTTAGCASVATVEAGTNDVDYKVLDFDKDTDEHAFVTFSMPNNYDGGTILVTFIWTTAGTTGTVVWTIKGIAFANDGAIDQSYGTAVTATDTFIAAGDVHISPETSAMTLAGSPAGGQLVQLKIMRDVSEDTLDADARLIAVSLRYKVASYSD